MDHPELVRMCRFERVERSKQRQGVHLEPSKWLDLPPPPRHPPFCVHISLASLALELEATKATAPAPQLGFQRGEKELDYPRITERNGSTRRNHNLATQPGTGPSPRQWVYS